MITIDSSISRYRAASYHLTISATIAALTLSAMLALWYPPSLFKAMGGMELIALIVGIDVCIGPLITLIIFDTRKKELVVDLAIVAALQLAALGYGVYATYLGRPVFTVFAEPQFVVVTAAEMDPDELRKGSREEFRRLSLTGPQLVATQEPSDREELSNIAFGAVVGMGIQHLPRYYVPYAEKRKDVLEASRPVADLDIGPEERERLMAYAARSGHPADKLRCLPVRTKRGLLTAIIDDRGDLLDILDISPTLRRR